MVLDVNFRFRHLPTLRESKGYGVRTKLQILDFATEILGIIFQILSIVSFML